MNKILKGGREAPKNFRVFDHNRQQVFLMGLITITIFGGDFLKNSDFQGGTLKVIF